MNPTVRPERKWIGEPVLLALHSQQIERYGGAHGILDSNVVLSALARPRNYSMYTESADVADLAARYLVAFAGSQGFADGNKRTGLACALVFLSINGVEIHVPPAELYALTLAVANHETSDAVAASYFRSRMTTKR
ncbi:MAG TPA: type II toxin-antitoxin system death-on-curing family toxin [Gemmatimonadaceae bacterium]|nr:type II toxin-antitoxin system death-on-curing family toxin [Gemmatimonadaceae bacterium]